MSDVAIIMGSDSDWPTLQSAAEVLDEYDISYTAEVISAHRMPDEMADFAKSAAANGYKVIIAGAGGAAHLPGMVASMTALPVIGVPVPLAHLDGMDSLLSIVQMPAGVPVATVGIGSAKNAGILAAKILAVSDKDLLVKVESAMQKLNQEAKAKGAALNAKRSQRTGF